MAREGLLTRAPAWCGGLVSALAEHAIDVEINGRLLTAAMAMLAGRAADPERLLDLHRSLVALYVPGAGPGRPGSDLERMKARLDAEPDIIEVRRDGGPLLGDFSI